MTILRESAEYFKFAKAIFPAASMNGAFGRRIGERLEIIPKSNPFSIKPGRKLPVEVLYMNKPLAGVGVEIGDGKTRLKEQDIPRYKTDRRGIALVPLGGSGLQIIAVDYRTAPRFPQLSDHDDYGATLAYFPHSNGR